MPVKAQKLGPGVFSIGSIGSALDLTAQVTAFKVTPSVDSEDATPTLDGGELAGDRDYTWTISGTLFQDLSEDGMYDYTWGHPGEEVPFTFTPITTLGRDVTGVVIVDPLELGGDVRKKNTVDFEWTVVGQPALGDVIAP